jgi:hypothetical protein
VSDISCPVTCILGARTQPLFEPTTRAAAELIPAAELRVIERSNHAFVTEAPQEFAAAIREGAARRVEANVSWFAGRTPALLTGRVRSAYNARASLGTPKEPTEPPLSPRFSAVLTVLRGSERELKAVPTRDSVVAAVDQDAASLRV